MSKRTEERTEGAAAAVTRAEALRRRHGARAHSAYDRAVAACRYAGVGQDAAEAVPRDPVGRAANALRLSAESLAALTGSAPDPAADARCARNAAATAALAAQVAAARDDDGTAAATATATAGSGSAYGSGSEPGSESPSAAATALRAALTASQAAAAAAAGSARGQDAALNSTAEEAERHAVATARAAGWLPVNS
ncbi:hypothetical protein AQI95_01110 [Streptomyces yokosukanensis]|uniref:Uncharacterized protein n=1 Tax=Streptomyces yokosukanensis TaxID=67386 RepID=A0A101PF61_9ACTN|nr:hypothetical protein [Streptomyces yokosukanensis]KUN10358.1 hypothetical protein AQI95_01110 [Streptomyces yokosukanensis]